MTALARVLLAASPGPTIDGPRHRILARAADGGGDGATARRLADQLAAGTRPPRAGRRALMAVAAVVLVAVAVAAAGGARSPGNRTATPACPAVDQGCGPLPRSDGVVKTPTGRYRIGQPGDLVVVGRWGCRAAPALPALLRPAGGEVWVWTSWAAGAASVAAHLATRIPGARSVQVDPGPSGCDRLLVLRAGGGAVVVQPGGSHRGRAA